MSPAELRDLIAALEPIEETLRFWRHTEAARDAYLAAYLAGANVSVTRAIDKARALANAPKQRAEPAGGSDE